jgi:hypothetical protein
VKDLNPDAHVKVLKVTIKVNGETKDTKIINLFSFTIGDIVFDYCNNYMGDYIFAKLQLVLCKRFKTIQNDEQVYM